MKYLLGIVALLVVTKFALTSPDVMFYFNGNKELLLAIAITLASKPLLKRIFG